MAKRHINLDNIDVQDATQADDYEPLTFELRGETFTAVEAIPVMVQIRLGIAQDPDGENHERMQAFYDFVTGVVIPEDRERFEQALSDSKKAISEEQLTEYIRAIAEALSDPPSEGSQDSLTSRPGTTTPSTEASSPQDTGEASAI